MLLELKKNLVVYAAIILAASSSAFAYESKPTLYFAGLVSMGAYEDAEKSYSITSQLNKNGEIDRLLYEVIKKKGTPYYHLSNGLADVDQGQSKVMAVAINREFISEDEVVFVGEGLKRVIADVRLQILIVDFKTLTIEAMYHDSFSYHDILADTQRLDKKKEKDIIKRLYFGDGSNSSIVEDIAEIAQNINPKKISKTRVTVENVKVQDAVLAHLPDDRSVEQVAEYIGNTFTASLAEHFDVQVIPYSKDYAIGGQMAARFSSGKVYNLSLPTPSLSFSLSLNKLKKQRFKNTVYSTFFDVELKSGVSGHLVFSDIFRGWAEWIETNSPTAQSEWLIYEDAIEGLLEDIAIQLYKPESAWFKDHAKKGRQTFNAARATRENFIYEP